MTPDVEKVLHGYMSLSAAEKLELKREINKYDDSSELQKGQSYRDLHEKRITGATSSATCLCCGK